MFFLYPWNILSMQTRSIVNMPNSEMDIYIMAYYYDRGLKELKVYTKLSSQILGRSIFLIPLSFIVILPLSRYLYTPKLLGQSEIGQLFFGFHSAHWDFHSLLCHRARKVSPNPKNVINAIEISLVRDTIL